ncbi:UDP-N-acetylmuramoyl-tripeptide--D-alanyl-D-alanine ligase [Sinobacterium caligoides]|uniref:UDP-N-acetylmuramoyl-tripeptide--D-alanyl-D-alanine ligase n=1 Tax=Sinobacterium caligoides TaxID=933926 RepID=A0A3N2D4Q6_9GAMM|nr:UDP-N-acetylmuramoyl-tripeptide--D-alanyl-D-alanine ligase [Sinobacterium caligoides]ROR94785.1 UDP-N-acetylmuramoyl-tripeptide--D-alanyl-D-alanine ligase [Sinobacterium caligoides]
MITSVSLQYLVSKHCWRMVGRDYSFLNIAIDSRSVLEGDLFVALSGEHFDAHDFVAQAVSNGAGAVVVSRELDIDVPQLIVPDPRLALGLIAAENRRLSKAKIVAITGSAGKTTTKEMLASIFSQAAGADAVLATKGNFNNEVGVPLTLLRLQARHRFAVVEMGAAKAGDIAYLMPFAQPDCSILLNAKAAHLEGFGSCEVVAQTKFGIVKELSADAIAVINSDTEYSQDWQQQGQEIVDTVIGFSLQDESSTIRAENIKSDFQASRFNLLIAERSSEVRLEIAGLHNISNALAAAAAAYALGISDRDIVQGLEAFKAVDGRLLQCKGVSGSVVIDDSYNANPSAMRAALDVLVKAEGRSVFVMGQMGELGADALEYHREVGAYAKSIGVDKFYGCGELCLAAAQGYGADGHYFASQEKLIAELQQAITKGDVVLVKGSRSAKMEIVVKAIVSKEVNKQGGN